MANPYARDKLTSHVVWNCGRKAESNPDTRDTSYSSFTQTCSTDWFQFFFIVYRKNTISAVRRVDFLPPDFLPTNSGSRHALSDFRIRISIQSTLYQ
jgi:hypothetical protein